MQGDADHPGRELVGRVVTVLLAIALMAAIGWGADRIGLGGRDEPTRPPSGDWPADVVQGGDDGGDCAGGRPGVCN